MKRIKYNHIIVLLMTCLLTACAARSPMPASVTDTSPAGPASADWFQVYFTDPTSIHARDYEGGPDKNLVMAIDQARLSVDVAAYSLNLWSIRDALIRARSEEHTSELQSQRV
jgi:hypothetical protein